MRPRDQSSPRSPSHGTCRGVAIRARCVPVETLQRFRAALGAPAGGEGTAVVGDGLVVGQPAAGARGCSCAR